MLIIAAEAYLITLALLLQQPQCEGFVLSPKDGLNQPLFTVLRPS